MGDFVTPGQQKITTELAVGGITGDPGLISPQGGPSNNSNNSGGTGSSTSNTNNGSSQNTQGSNIVLAAGTFSNVSNGPSSDSNSLNTQIAGLSFSKPVIITQDSDKKIVNLNLAWFLLLIPLLLLPIAYKLVKKSIDLIISARERRGYV
jgi:hypothetical protein